MDIKLHHISWLSIWRIIGVIIFLIVAYFAREAIIVLLLAIIISLALDPPVDFLSRKFRIPRILSTVLVFTIGILLASFAISFMVPIIIFEFSALLRNLDGVATDVLFKDLSLIIDIITNNFSLIGMGQIINILITGEAPIAQTIWSIISGIALGISILIISFYLTLSDDGVGKFLRAILPDTLEEGVLKIYYRSKKKIGIWFQAQILLSIFVGTLVSLGLLILGVRYPFVIGALAGLLEIMPIVGPFFSGGVGTIIALSDSLNLGLYTMILFILIQQLESNFLVPIFMKRVINIHPVIVLFSIMAGFQLFGIIGMIMSVPAAVIFQDIIEERIKYKRFARESKGNTK